MRRALYRLLLLLMVPALACATQHADTRIERGPLLDTFQRQVALPGHLLSVDVEPRWPNVTLTFNRVSVCRDEEVEVYAEQVITQKRVPAAGPTLSTGIVNTLLGGGLLLARPLFPDEPDRSRIDAQGRYGPSTRQVVTGISVVLLVVGVPALITGGVSLFRVGEEKRERKVEEVVSLKETQCGARTTSGSVELLLASGVEGQGPFELKDGALEFTAEAVRELPIRGFTLDGDVAVLNAEEEEALEAFRLCARALTLPLPEAPTDEESRSRVGELLGLARRCEQQLPEAPAEERIQQLQALLAPK